MDMAKSLRSTIPEKPARLRAKAIGSPGSVDRENNRLLGYVVAQKGVFKDERGEFDDDALTAIVSLMKANKGGTKSHFAHPTLSDDGLGKYLGRAKNPRLDGDMIRADLYFNETAFNTPNGDLAGYILDLAESDSNAMSSSLVLEVAEEYRMTDEGKPIRDKDGYLKPPIWRPLKIWGSDIVDTGAAVDGLLSHDGLPDELAARTARMLDSIFEDHSCEVIRSRCLAYLDRYLGERFGKPEQLKDDTWRVALAAHRTNWIKRETLCQEIGQRIAAISRSN
jgi:hypothetical protein